MKRTTRFSIICIIGLVAISVSLRAQTDPVKLQHIRDNLTHYNHLKHAQRHAAILRITNAPQEYLMNIAADETLKMYVRTRAMVLLAEYSDDVVGEFLEKRIGNSREDSSLRGWAIKSYAGAFYKRNPDRVKKYLRNVKARENRYVSNKAAEVLKKLSP